MLFTPSQAWNVASVHAHAEKWGRAHRLLPMVEDNRLRARPSLRRRKRDPAITQ